VAILFDIPRRSLTRYVEKKKKSGLEEQNMPNSVFLQPIMGIHLSTR
jgi:hypothetical protein